MSPRLGLARQDERALDYFLDLSRSPSSQDQLDLDPQRRISLYFVVASSHRDGKCFVQLKISPFKSKYSDFRYHFYSIHASFAGEQTERQPENLKVAESIQQAYDSVNFRPCKYPFKFGQDEVHMVAFDALHWPPTLQSIGYGESGAVTRSEQPDRIDFHMVQQSYVDARDSGRLRSGLIPSLAQFETEVRHPLCISGRQDSLKTALLNPSKVDSINRDVRAVLSSVPKPEDWCTVVKEKHLGASDVLQIIRLATGDLPRTIGSSVPSTHTSIANMITCLREHAQALRSTGVLYRYARQLTDLLVCSLMQVQEHISGGDRAASVAANAAMSSIKQGSHDWQKRSRKFSQCCHHLFAHLDWGGREIPLYLQCCSRKLKDRFSSSNPAFYGELACVLKSDEYQKLDPQEAQSWREVPTFLDIIKKVINGCVEDDTVHIALGYSIAHRRQGFASRWEFDFLEHQQMTGTEDPSLLEWPEEPEFDTI